MLAIAGGIFIAWLVIAVILPLIFELIHEFGFREVLENIFWFLFIGGGIIYFLSIIAGN